MSSHRSNRHPSPSQGEGAGGGRKHHAAVLSTKVQPPSLPSPYEGEGEKESADNFLHRWSQRKHRLRKQAHEVVPETPAVVTPEPPAKVLTDADMPPIESLGADSDYSPFMSSGVSEELRQQALQKLFRLPQFSQRDPLDGEYYDCHGYEPLGDTITHEMREEMEREAEKRKQEEARLAQAKGAMPAPSAQSDSAAKTETPAVAKVDPAARRHTGHLHKRGKKRRSSQ